MPTRRKFLASASALTLGASLPALSENQKEKKVLVHHVFFWLKKPGNKEDLAKLIEGVSSLKKIESLRMVKIGLAAGTIKRDVIDDSYSLSLLTTFDDVKGHDTYQDHPIHTKFVETYSPLWNKVVVYDSMDI
ncbi:MAG: Dabb family protein [Cyclobacteriaceae bacterium]|nr:Dabb family protein [Cyclobacteriaceae bacterium]